MDHTGDGSSLATKLAFIRERSKMDPKRRWTTLAYLLNEANLKDCFYELKRTAAPGVDQVTMQEYEERLDDHLADLVRRLKQKSYRPQPVRRVYIPKDQHQPRPLGIPTVEDKIVHIAISRILEAIWEADFLEVSYGFRPGRGAHQALTQLDRIIMSEPIEAVVDMDIEKFFDTVDQTWLLECLKQRIADPTFLRLIVRFFKAGVMEDGQWQETERGVPQGAVLSPVLSNIYLHYILDLWFEKQVKSGLVGKAHLIRYADDFVVCFEREAEAHRFAQQLKERLAKFGLKIAEAKSRVLRFGRHPWVEAQRTGEKMASFDFLGFTHYGEKTRRGCFKLGRKTSRKKLRQKLVALNQWFRAVRNACPLPEWWATLAAKLRGHYQYYGISGNMPALRVFFREAVRLAQKWINRRSQRRRYRGARFWRFLEHHPLPPPRIVHRIYQFV
jgi:RNA-directed DNA polymerase